MALPLVVQTENGKIERWTKSQWADRQEKQLMPFITSLVIIHAREVKVSSVRLYQPHVCMSLMSGLLVEKVILLRESLYSIFQTCQLMYQI